jgi:hypothetical protein
MKNRLHIYAQSSYHEHAFIVGDTESLEMLRDAIESALNYDGIGMATSYASDGEGFELEVYREDGHAFWDKSRLPYTDEDAKDRSKDRITPWDLFKKHRG